MRTHRVRRSSWLAAGALLLAGLAPAIAVGTTLGAPAHAADGKVTFTVAVRGEVDSLNPFVGVLAAAYESWALTYDYMIGYDNADMSPAPTGLATSWDTADDGLTWTFHIRDGVMWSDGQKLTAADIAYTYNRVLHGEVEGTTWAPYLLNVTSVTAPDPETVVLKLDKPNAVLPLLPIPILPEHVWKHVSEKQVKSYAAAPKNGQPVVGSGPFRLVEGSAGGSTFRFEANPDYWGGAPHIDEVVFRTYRSDDPAVQALIKGEVDFAWNIQPLQVKALQGKPGITAHNGDSPGIEEIGFNTGSVDLKTNKPIGDPNPALEDPKFRQALGYAIDRKAIVDKAFQGAATVGSSIIPDAYDVFHWTPSKDDTQVYDPDKAAQMLDAAGYKVGGNGLRTLPNGDPIGTLRLFARSESPSSLKVMEFFKEWLAAVGIDSEIKAVGDDNLSSIILDGRYDAFAWGWFVEPDPQSMLSYMTCDQRGGWSDSWYCNPAYDKLFQQQSVELDDNARAALVKQMQQILYDEAPYLVTAYDTYGEAFRSDRFACLRPQPEPDGVWIMQYGVSTYRSIRPASQADQCEGVKGGTKATSAGESNSVSTGLLVGLGVAAVAGAAGAGIFVVRRRRTAGERE